MDRSVQSPLIAALKDKDVRVRRAAAKALGGEEHQGAQALEALTEALRDKDVEVRSAAVASLEDQGEAALGPLAGVVKDPAPKVRRAAISALGRVYSGMAGKAPSLAPLLEALKDKDLMVRVDAASAIPRTKEMVPQLLTALKNEPKEARLEIIHVLELIGPGARAAVPALVEALKDPDVVVRHSAADALKAIDAAAAKRAGLDD
jgi:HEAT repeat protein